jgi:hypothetical protein
METLKKNFYKKESKRRRTGEKRYKEKVNQKDRWTKITDTG